MRRCFLVEPGNIRLEEVPVPIPRNNEVLVKVRVCGICGADLQIYRGRHPIARPPMIQGHEFCGTVAKVGFHVSAIEEEDRVAVEPSVPCGKCYNCSHGRYNICSDLSVIGGRGHDGALSEYVTVPGDKVVPLPDEISFEEGALVEPTAVAVHAVRLAEQKVGERVLVLGAGTIGLLVVQAARTAGAREVIVSDVLDYRLEKAIALGANKRMNPRSEHIYEALDKEYGRDGIDTVYDCVGNQETVRQALQIARRGTRIMMIGVPEEPVTLDLTNLQEGELELRGSLMYLRADFLKAIDLIRKREIKVTPLITHRFSLTQVQDAFRLLTKREEQVLKVLIHVSQ